MDIYTAHYRYPGPDRIDITVKGNLMPGKVLAPDWDMVKGYQAGTIDQWTYTIKYFATITNRIMQIGDEWRLALDIIGTTPGSITLVCFCKPQTFCHRVLAAQLLQEMSYGKYHGERIL